MHQNTQEQNVGAHFLILMLLVLNTELIYTDSGQNFLYI